jgi:hypothetical protein
MASATAARQSKEQKSGATRPGMTVIRKRHAGFRHGLVFDIAKLVIIRLLFPHQYTIYGNLMQDPRALQADFRLIFR